MPLPTLEKSLTVPEKFFFRWQRQDARMHRRVAEHRVEFHVIEPAAIIATLVAVMADCGLEMFDAVGGGQTISLTGFVSEITFYGPVASCTARTSTSSSGPGTSQTESLAGHRDDRRGETTGCGTLARSPTSG